MKWIYYIFRLYRAPKCQHRWSYKFRVSVLDGEKPVGFEDTYECKKCGTPKMWSIKSR